jgi:TIR domain
MVDVFISHSNQDVELATHVVDLLRAALNLRAEQIRCTSVEGYRLPAGADFDSQLRDEALKSRVFIGILSAFSLASAYVLFELGARWGAKRPIMPLLAPGTGLQVVKGPLTGLNVLSCENVSQLHQMVSEVADVLEISSESPAVYQRHIEAILYLAHPVDLESTNGKTPKDKGDPAVKISHSNNVQTEPIDDYSDAEQVIKRHCQHEWPSDYSMRSYCVKQQREALATLRRGCPPDIPNDVFASVRDNCAREWPDDYSMRLYCEQQQFDAFRELEHDDA